MRDLDFAPLLENDPPDEPVIHILNRINPNLMLCFRTI
jgi:hypothetical protein